MTKKILSSSQGYDILAKDYNKFHNFLDSFDWKEIKDILKKYLLKNLLILDAGCGDGRITNRFKDYKIISVDVSRLMLLSLKQRNKDSLCVQSDVLSLPFKDFSFDIVMAFFLLVHIHNLSDFFYSISRVLKKDGLLICNCIPQRSSPVFGKGKNKFKINSYNHSFRLTLKAAEKEGFNLIHSKDIVQNGVCISTVCVFKLQT